MRSKMGSGERGLGGVLRGSVVAGGPVTPDVGVRVLWVDPIVMGIRTPLLGARCTRYGARPRRGS